MSHVPGRQRGAACLAVLLLLTAAVGGCLGVSSGQIRDFGLTEVSRVISDLVGQFVGILLRATLPGAGQ